MAAAMKGAGLMDLLGPPKKMDTPEPDPGDMALGDAADALMEAIKSNSREGVMDALKAAYHACSMPDDEEGADAQPMPDDAHD